MGCGVSNCTDPLTVNASNTDVDPLQLMPTRAFKDDYKRGSLLGKGTFGTVYRCQHKREKVWRAVKVIDRQRIKGTSIFREWTVLEAIRRSNCMEGVVNYYGAYKNAQEIAFVFELCEGGELFEKLVRDGPLSEDVARKAFYHLAVGLQKLHALEPAIVHRDIKPENILIGVAATGGELVLKISDFGLAQFIGANERLLKVCGTWCYSAPEMYTQGAGYDTKFDVFSWGILLFVALSATHPFDPDGHLTTAQIRVRAQTAQYSFDSPPEWQKISDEAKDLISKCIVVDPAARVASSDLLNHPWFRGLSGVRWQPTLMGTGIATSETAAEEHATSAALLPISSPVAMSAVSHATTTSGFDTKAAVNVSLLPTTLEPRILVGASPSVLDTQNGVVITTSTGFCQLAAHASRSPFGNLMVVSAASSFKGPEAPALAAADVDATDIDNDADKESSTRRHMRSSGEDARSSSPLCRYGHRYVARTSSMIRVPKPHVAKFQRHAQPPRDAGPNAPAIRL